MSLPKDVAKMAAKSAVNALPHVILPRLSGTMWRLVDLAIDGAGKLPPARSTAAKHLEKRQDIDAAIKSVVRVHVGLASAQAFVTNFGGLISTAIGTPANAAGIVMVQVRMVACIAHLHGYDIDDPRVRTAMVMCLLGEKELKQQIKNGSLPSSPLAVATAPMHDLGLQTKAAERVLNQVLASSAGKDIAQFVTRRVPVVGGGIGAVTDGYGTIQVARCARNQLINRRVTTHRP
ncbi:MAG: EcsC family protein [Propionibacteriaceae bacterium]|jgi:ribosomal protein L12E/L44/L45/RPP1/RPP2|nr:EcsC family protein [Propionibacteriaceae bacterium]